MKNVSCYRLNLITALFHRKRSRKRAVSFNVEEYLLIYWQFLLQLIKNIKLNKNIQNVYKKYILTGRQSTWEIINDEKRK